LPIDGCGDTCVLDSQCDDGNFCNGIEICSFFTCSAGDAPCGDPLDCTDDSCDETNDRCVFEDTCPDWQECDFDTNACGEPTDTDGDGDPDITDPDDDNDGLLDYEDEDDDGDGIPDVDDPDHPDYALKGKSNKGLLLLWLLITIILLGIFASWLYYWFYLKEQKKSGVDVGKMYKMWELFRD